MNARVTAVLVALTLVAPSWADDKPKPGKSPPSVSITLDASKLPPEVLAQLLKLAADQKKPDGADKPKPGIKKPDAARPGKKSDLPPAGAEKSSARPGAGTLGLAVVMAEKSGKVVVKAEKIDGVFVLGLSDGTIFKVLAGDKKADAPGTKKGDPNTKKGDPNTKGTKKGTVPSTKKGDAPK